MLDVALLRSDERTSGRVVSAWIKHLVVVHKTHSQVIEESNPANDVDRDVVRLGEIYNCVPLNIADGA